MARPHPGAAAHPTPVGGRASARPCICWGRERRRLWIAISPPAFASGNLQREDIAKCTTRFCAMYEMGVRSRPVRDRAGHQLPLRSAAQLPAAALTCGRRCRAQTGSSAPARRRECRSLIGGMSANPNRRSSGRATTTRWAAKPTIRLCTERRAMLMPPSDPWGINGPASPTAPSPPPPPRRGQERARGHDAGPAPRSA